LISSHDPREVIRRLTLWADRKYSVRAMLLTSTRANPDATVDVISDYDAVLVVEDVRPCFEDRSWLGDFGEVLVAYWDPIYPDPDHGIEQTGNVTQYESGLKIDFTLWPTALPRRIAQAPALPDELDAGYAVLLDKDGLFDTMSPPSYGAYVPDRPDEGTYLTVVNDFLSDAPYVAKHLWRDELLPAKWCLDYDMKHVYLLRIAGALCLR
jgi:aminoglycoside 6-adenylyltransferase